jgi:hypothetical protein
MQISSISSLALNPFILAPQRPLPSASTSRAAVASVATPYALTVPTQQAYQPSADQGSGGIDVTDAQYLSSSATYTTIVNGKIYLGSADGSDGIYAASLGGFPDSYTGAWGSALWETSPIASIDTYA